MANYRENEKNRFNNLEIWQLHDYEIATFLHSPRDESEQDVYKLHITALMPFIPIIPVTAGSQPTPVQLTKSIYANAPACSLPVKQTILTQTWLNVHKHNNEHFTHRWLDFGSKIYVETLNKDIDGLYVTTRLDPSYCNSCVSEHPYYYCQPLEYHCNC